MTLLKERLLEAQERKENDIKNFTWLYPKDRDNGNVQNEVKLVSCTIYILPDSPVPGRLLNVSTSITSST